MLGLGIPEMVLIMVAALLIFGPKRLPEIGQSVGKAMREFKKGVNDIKDNFENVIPEDIMSTDEKPADTSPVTASKVDSTSSVVDQAGSQTTAVNDNVAAPRVEDATAPSVDSSAANPSASKSESGSN